MGRHLADIEQYLVQRDRLGDIHTQDGAANCAGCSEAITPAARY